MQCVIESLANVDWLTATQPLASATLAGHAESLFMSLAEEASIVAEEDLALLRIGERELLGFRGLGMAGLFVGDSATHRMVQASGWLAGAVWRRLDPWAWKATRIDVQETLWLATDLPRAWAMDMAHAARQHRGRATGRGPMPLIDYIDSDAGCTLYVGRPAAEQRGRIYDKFQESQDGRYRGAYRMEIQCRGKAAEGIHAALGGAQLADSNDMRRLVHSWFADRWLTLRSTDLPPLRIAPVREDAQWVAESKLAWLEQQVRPTVTRLLSYVERETIMASLGLIGDGGPTDCQGE